MIDRRSLMFTAAAGASLLAAGQVIARPQDAASASGALAGVMNAIVQDSLLTSPELLTQLGFDKGPNAAMKARLDDRSQAKVEADEVKFRGHIADLKAVDRTTLSADEKVYFDTLEFFGDTTIEGYGFPYGGGGFGPSPYTVSQLTGAYQSLPDFLDSQHSIDTAEDAEAYLSRVSAFATALDQETDRMQRDFAAGAVPPDFVIERTLSQMASLMASGPQGTTLVQSVARRTGEKALAGDWAGAPRRSCATRSFPP
jgi:uncharacterized protein (DUF885 family)